MPRQSFGDCRRQFGARHSFREAAKLLNELTPCTKQNHVTIRSRLAAVTEDRADSELSAAAEADQRSNPSDVTVFLESAYVRSRPKYQRRNFEIIVGSIESERRKKRRMRWPPKGAHRVPTVRAPFLDGWIAEGQLRAAYPHILSTPQAVIDFMG